MYSFPVITLLSSSAICDYEMLIFEGDLSAKQKVSGMSAHADSGLAGMPFLVFPITEEEVFISGYVQVN